MNSPRWVRTATPSAAWRFRRRDDLLASGAYDGKVKLWNWKDRLPVGELDIGDQVQAVAFLPMADGWPCAARGHGCQLWDVGTRLMIADSMFRQWTLAVRSPFRRRETFWP